MSKKTVSKQPLIREAEYIVIDMGWEDYIILPWELGIQFLKTICSAVRVRGNLNLDEEGKVTISEPHFTKYPTTAMTHEHYEALRMKALVTGDE